VLLAVSDTGIGMDAQTMTHLFEPFFTTKAPGRGTGLGLATVYGIVEQSEGYVCAYSEPGQGATFKIYLPQVDGRPRPATATPVLENSDGSETVLLVEDENEVRRVASRILKTHGYAVLEAHDGKEALEIAAASMVPIHILVTDVVMPGMNGRELAGALAEKHPNMRVLFTSGYADHAIVRHGELEPGLAFIQKPFTANGLARKVREVLDRGSS
jgi:CheY-like chemotaxis protein